MNEYERGYGLQDAMKQLRSFKAKFQRQENENIDLKNRLNERERLMFRLLSENGIGIIIVIIFQLKFGFDLLILIVFY